MTNEDKDKLKLSDFEFVKYILSILISSNLDFETMINELYNKEKNQFEYEEACKKICQFLNIKNLEDIDVNF